MEPVGTLQQRAEDRVAVPGAQLQRAEDRVAVPGAQQARLAAAIPAAQQFQFLTHISIVMARFQFLFFTAGALGANSPSKD